MGYMYFELNENDKSLYFYNKAAKLNKKDSEIYYMKAVLEYGFNINDAFTSCKKALNIDKQMWQAYCLLGHIYVDMKKYDEAIKKYTKAIRLSDLEHKQLYSSRAEARIKNKEFQKAIKDCNKAIELNDTDWCAFQHRADAYFELEKYDLALNDYMTAQDLISNKEIDKNFAENIEKCKSKLQVKKFI